MHALGKTHDVHAQPKYAQVGLAVSGLARLLAGGPGRSQPRPGHLCTGVVLDISHGGVCTLLGQVIWITVSLPGPVLVRVLVVWPFEQTPACM